MVRDDDTPLNTANSAIAEHVLAAYRASGLYCLVKGQHMWVSCPFHGGGNEKTGSMRINLSDHRFRLAEGKCFACSGKNIYSWNEIAKARNLPPLSEGGDANDLWLKIPSSGEFYGKAQDPVVVYPWPKGKWWRTIKPSLLRKLGVRRMQSGDNVRVYFPVEIGGILVGHVDACETGESDNKYLLSGPWSNHVMYPMALASKMALISGYVVLVEGHRDALRLIQYGVPALCFWGTSAWNKEKTKTIRSLGVIPVIATDGDKAGDDCRELMQVALASLKPIHVRFAPKHDPGKMKKAEVLEMKAMLDRAVSKNR